MLDMHEVVGSIPIAPTNKTHLCLVVKVRFLTPEEGRFNETDIEKNSVMPVRYDGV